MTANQFACMPLDTQSSVLTDILIARRSTQVPAVPVPQVLYLTVKTGMAYLLVKSKFQASSIIVLYRQPAMFSRSLKKSGESLAILWTSADLKYDETLDLGGTTHARI